MFTRADIRRVSIVVKESDYSALMVSLGRSGIVHIDSRSSGWTDDESPYITAAPVSIDATHAAGIISAALEFLSETGGAAPDATDYDRILDDIPGLFSRRSEEDIHESERTGKKIQQYNDTRAALVNMLESLETRLARIMRLSGDGIDIQAIRGLKDVSYLYAGGSIKDTPCAIDKRIFYIQGSDYVIAIFPSELRDSLPACLNIDGYEDLDYVVRRGNSLPDEEDATRKRIDEINKRIARIDSFYSRALPLWQERMRCLAALYSILLQISGSETELHFSGEIVAIHGWVNAADEDKLRDLLCGVCGTGFYFKTGSRAEGKRFRDIMPVLLKNNPLFKPFELLVRMMGVPGNSEVDPTPAAALSYVVIFGVMFGDAGQGLVLALAGFILRRYGNKRYGAGNSISDFGSIMTWCGFSAAAFGLLYGSVFSSEHLIPAILFHPMEHMMQLLLMAIMTGAVFISTGLVLNIINGFVAARYGDAFFGAKGVPGLVVYASFVFFAMRFIFSGTAPAPRELAAALALPAGLFCLRGPLEYFIFHGEHMFHQDVFEYVVETIIEIMEMFSGFLGNTISYIRAGAFALSHAGLSIAVFTLAAIVDPAMKSIPAFAVIITGNVFIILLEGLVCGIQSMRLEYYEFFGKFFKGDGEAFTPFAFEFKQVKDGGGK